MTAKMKSVERSGRNSSCAWLPLQIALAEHAAGADRDLRLDDVIARAERIVLRIEERQHALPLIVVQQELPGDDTRPE